MPVLVGGAAVELFTGGAYTTGDLDFVGRLDEEVEEALREMGFSKRGRHWVHDREKVLIELPGRFLGADQRPVWLEVRGRSLRVLSPEDVLVDRLAAWKHWASGEDGVNAYRLFRSQEEALERRRLDQRAEREHVSDALEELRIFAAEHAGGEPDEGELVEWARRVR